MDRFTSTLLVATFASLVALGGITATPKPAPASFKPDNDARLYAQIAELEDRVQKLQAAKTEIELQLAAAARPIIEIPQRPVVSFDEPKMTQPQPIPVTFTSGGCANGPCSLSGSGPIRSTGRAVGRVGRRVGWRVTHPFGGRLRRR